MQLMMSSNPSEHRFAVLASVKRREEFHDSFVIAHRNKRFQIIISPRTKKKSV